MAGYMIVPMPVVYQQVTTVLREISSVPKRCQENVNEIVILSKYPFYCTLGRRSSPTVMFFGPKILREMSGGLLEHC